VDSFSVSRIERVLLNKAVSFWLSPAGREAVKHIFEDKESFRAHVEAVDELGVWLRLPPKRGGASRNVDSLLLLKWDYLATAQVGAEPGAGEEVKGEVVH
jgi:hypothetical protein